MANTYVLISSVTVGSGGAATIDFSSIPATYTDLCVKASLRDTYTGSATRPFTLKLNGSGTSYTAKFVYGDGAAAASFSDTSGYVGYVPTASATASTFGSADIYLPNYAGSNYKSSSIDAVTENNATTAIASLAASLWSNTAAINQITLIPYSGFNFVQYSTAYLYGIKNS